MRWHSSRTAASTQHYGSREISTRLSRINAELAILWRGAGLAKRTDFGVGIVGFVCFVRIRGHKPFSHRSYARDCAAQGCSQFVMVSSSEDAATTIHEIQDRLHLLAQDIWRMAFNGQTRNGIHEIIKASTSSGSQKH